MAKKKTTTEKLAEFAKKNDIGPVEMVFMARRLAREYVTEMETLYNDTDPNSYGRRRSAFFEKLAQEMSEAIYDSYDAVLIARNNK